MDNEFKTNWKESNVWNVNDRVELGCQNRALSMVNKHVFYFKHNNSKMLVTSLLPSCVLTESLKNPT